MFILLTILGYLVAGYLTFRGCIRIYKPEWGYWRQGWDTIYGWKTNAIAPCLVRTAFYISVFFWPIVWVKLMGVGIFLSAKKLVGVINSSPFIPRQYLVPPSDKVISK
jgi:hypothetical protein